MLSLVAIASSVALFVDYISPTPAFCSAGSGCSAVRQSGLGYVGGIPLLPVVGVLSFSMLFALSLSLTDLRKLLAPAAYVGALVALVLIGLQAFWIHRFCSLCVIVDSAAILIAIAAFLRARASPTPVKSPKTAYRSKASNNESASNVSEELFSLPAWLILGVIAVVAPWLWSQVKPNPAVPGKILALYQPGKINVVEFADFECPFCRMLHPTLKKLIAERGDQVHFVRLNMPLPHIHPNALDAAKGAVCGEEQGKQDEMADRLFESEDITPSGVRRIAATLHLDVRKFDECIQNPATAKRIDDEQKILREAGFEGLPTTYIGSEMIVGAVDESNFREAMDHAARGEGSGGIPGWLYAILVAAAVGATLQLGRAKKATPPPK